MEAENNMAVWRSVIEAHEHYFKPISRELGMPQMALDILLFLADHPDQCTAKDISLCHGFKENILSININKLVTEGYLERQPVEGDRRKVRLVCTEKSAAIIARCCQAGTDLAKMLEEGLTAEDKKAMQRCLAIIGNNAEQIKKIKM